MKIYHIKYLEHIKTIVIELYVMVLNNMVLLLNLVINHVNNSNSLLYKMEMVNKDGVVVIMN